ncbi:uncharacterized protein LOC127804687 isoform X3 [Diospyros lotus]|uniref:uncharacterized protein LOC127804687 isoform X3 n=1 Tax=Diospyros lotus TaxID=55363 RepID=UPI0022597B7E|nr:uncharacterized protein LOC127804687 isoform X3 [Diospyros lotus]
MAADSSSSSKRKLSDREEKTGKSGEKKPKKESDSSCLSPAKRTKNPGVRVIGGRVYDSDKGRTCHQCRQKTLDFVAACKNQKKNKPCTIMFCHKCLFNRYGEKAEKMADLEDWICPKCRGICNCSLCMKKRGHRPTGILVHTARATGFSSVSDMLNVKGPENLGIGRTVKGIDIGTEAVASEREEPPIALPRKRGKENSFSETNVSASNFAEQKQKKMKYGRLKVMPDRKQDEWTLSNSPLMPPVSNHSLRDMQDGTQDEWTLSKKCCPSPQKCQIAKEGLKAKKVSNWADESMMRETIHRKPEISNGVSKKDVTNGQTVLDVEEAKLVPVMSKGVSSKLKKCEKSKEQRNSKCQKDLEVLDTKKLDYAGAQLLIPVESYKGQTKDLELLNKDIDANITLPEGTELTSVAGIDLPPEDVGHALEFLEFCSAFGKGLLELDATAKHFEYKINTKHYLKVVNELEKIKQEKVFLLKKVSSLERLVEELEEVKIKLTKNEESFASSLHELKERNKELVSLKAKLEGSYKQGYNEGFTTAIKNAQRFKLHNSIFKDGWIKALKKAGVPLESELYTLVPLPDLEVHIDLESNTD